MNYYANVAEATSCVVCMLIINVIANFDTVLTPRQGKARGARHGNGNRHLCLCVPVVQQSGHQVHPQAELQLLGQGQVPLLGDAPGGAQPPGRDPALQQATAPRDGGQVLELQVRSTQLPGS